MIQKKQRSRRFSGRRLAVARDRVGLSQVKLGELASVSARAILYYERDQRQPPADILYALADAVGCHPDALMVGRKSRRAITVRRQNTVIN